MCDNCGNIFSLNSENWDQYTRQHTQRVPSNSQPVVTGQTTMHICGDCNQGTTSALRPRIALPAKAATMGDGVDRGDV